MRPALLKNFFSVFNGKLFYSSEFVNNLYLGHGTKIFDKVFVPLSTKHV